MFQCRKDKGGCANIKFGCANTSVCSANMGFIAAGHQRATKLKIQNGDDDTNLFICSFVAFFFISSLLILPFQIGCTYVLLSGTRVNVFHFHVARNHCSSIRSLGHIYDTTSKSCWNINFNILNKPSNSKMSNQKNQIYFVFVIRNIRLQCKDGK